jgi:hypothetical protein
MTEESLRLPKYAIGVEEIVSLYRAKGNFVRAFLRCSWVEAISAWNKSNPEHMVVGSDPSQTRRAAQAAVKDLAWTRPYPLADHIGLKTVERFIEPMRFTDTVRCNEEIIARGLTDIVFERHIRPIFLSC